MNYAPRIILLTKQKRVRWAGHVALVGGNKNAYRLLRGKYEGKKTGVDGDMNSYRMSSTGLI